MFFMIFKVRRTHFQNIERQVTSESKASDDSDNENDNSATQNGPVFRLLLSSPARNHFYFFIHFTDVLKKRSALSLKNATFT